MLRMERQASAKEGQKTDQLKAEMEAFKEEITQQKEKLKELRRSYWLARSHVA